MMKKLGSYLLAKDSNAIIVAFICALLPMFYVPSGFVAAIIVALVTLQKGEKAGLIVLAWVALPAIALLVLRRVGVFDVLLVRAAVIWVMAILMRRFQSWGLVLEAAVLIGVVVIVGLHLLVPDMQQFWIGHLTSYVDELSRTSEWRFSVSPGEVVKRVAPIATGVTAFLFLSGLVLELVIARLWQYAVTSTTKGFAKEFLQLRIGQFSAGIAVLLFILAMLKIPMMVDIAPLVFLPFFVTGLSLMHFFARLKKPLIGVVLVVYVGLIFLPMFVVSLLAAVGFVDSWTDLRKKVVKK